MEARSAEHVSVSSLSDDTERHTEHYFETLIDDTDQTSATHHRYEGAPLPTAFSDGFDFALSPPTNPQESTWDTDDEHSTTMPGAHGGLKPWPNVNRQTGDVPSRDGSMSSVREQVSSATLRTHYDSTRQPLTISQQTSASSVRDMALRKGTPAVLKKNDKGDSRPLKSALKRYPSQQRDQAAVPRFLYPPEHEQPAAQPQKASSRFSLFGNLFRRSSSNKSIPSPQVSRASSTLSTSSSHHATPTGPRRKRSIGWEQPLQQYGTSIRSESAQSDRSDVVRQAKLAEGDVYEKAKMHIRRPPKGIQNWFDGVDVSSDEDDDLAPVELPAQEPLPSTFSTFGSRKQENRRSQQDPKRNTMSKAERMLGEKTNIARFEMDDRDQDPRPSRREEEYFDRAATPKASAQMRNQQRRYNNESALSMHSSMDGGETDHSAREHYDSDVAYGLASSMNMHRPQVPPRRLQSSQIAAHNAYVNERPRLLTQNSSSRFSSRSNEYHEEYDERPQTASRKGNRTSETPRSRGRASTRLSSQYDHEDGGVRLDLVSPDISHLMAVTEEEMALLEMMRNKRAAMQKDSYSEGYRQALKREHEQLVQKRMAAQQTALRMLRAQQEQQLARRRQELGSRDADDKEIRKLNKLRQQEMDRMQRLEKFLAMDTSLAAALDDAGISQGDEVVQNWPLAQQETVRSPGEGRSRNGALTPSFSRRDVYEESTSRSRQGRRERSSTNESNLALTFPNPPEALTKHHDHHREMEANLMRYGSAKTQAKGQRQSTQSFSKHLVNDHAFREERYTMSSHTIRPKQSQQLSRQQIQATTFLRSISDHQGAEGSVTSQGTSVVSPMTPSSNGGGGQGKGSSGFDENDVDFLNDSSPELTFAKSQPSQARKSKHLPSALAILAESDRSSYVGSMHSGHSAGEDVLAAWASLGGAEGMLPSRRR